MEPAFWHQRWAAQQIGFHQPQVNGYLQRHWPSLGLQAGARVLVPLCGKSLDLLWLLRQGYRVLGIELSREAVAALFSEHGLTPQITREGEFEVWHDGALQVWCGDFFALTASQVQDCSALYDRAALIALPRAMRERYLAQLSELLPSPCQGLLVTLEYDQALIDGPPFSVGAEEVQRGLKDWQVSEVERCDIRQDSPRFVAAGVSSLRERVYRLSR
ncbi:thiopurine S-methyltransferase [Pseudomonas cremoricolorata]|uniref:Thiopurine S-methyltransferase n=1 Tax=Pseudomonas cremoricolorata TaxID=157783 RepID=A0A089WSN0_9PSED|nr:thiopurine S-methyltransferase [Pseudomonas cremoricolorata]AIR91611.1 thiopurine S-methyltransferase [Pseudomonas cremoricolorata]